MRKFRKEYQIDAKVGTLLICFNQSQLLFQCCVVQDLGGAKDIEYIRKGMLELSVSLLSIYLSTVTHLTLCRRQQTWDWAFGQTPEFTHTLQRTFSWGEVVRRPLIRQGFSPLTTVFIRQLRSDQNMVLFWIVLFN